MSILEKLKLLIKAKEPIEEIIIEVKNAGAGWKTIHFWVTLLASLGLLATALTGVMPPMAAVFLTASLAALYNILHGLDQANQEGVLPLLKSPSFWITVLGSVSSWLVALQTGGVSYSWVATAQGLIASTGLVNQNLSAQTPPQQ